MDGPNGAWVHAYLHRKKGDTINAAYWYRRAGRRVVTGALKQEWESMAVGLLSGPVIDGGSRVQPCFGSCLETRGGVQSGERLLPPCTSGAACLLSL